MEARIEVSVEQLGGSSKLVVTSELEPDAEAWNERTFQQMARSANMLLAAVLTERDKLAFEDEVRRLRNHHREEEDELRRRQENAAGA